MRAMYYTAVLFFKEPLLIQYKLTKLIIHMFSIFFNSQIAGRECRSVPYFIAIFLKKPTNWLQIHSFRSYLIGLIKMYLNASSTLKNGN